MKVKTFLGLFILIVIVGLACSIVFDVFSTDTDTDTDQINERFDITIDVISIRQHPSKNKLFLVVYEYYDPECGCYEEVTILANPHEYRSMILDINTPKTIKMRGNITNSIYNIEWLGN